MDNIEKAAVLLMGIGEDNAAAVLKLLEPRHVQRVGKAMTTCGDVSKEQVQLVLTDFVQEADRQSALGVDAPSFIKTVITEALGKEKAGSFIDRILSTNKEDDGLSNLKWLEPKAVADMIRNEHPQVIATILTYLESTQAAEVVTNFSEEKRVDILMRMAAIDMVKPEALQELSKVIEVQLEGHKGSGKSAEIGGIKCVADLVNNLDSTVESQVIDAIKKLDPTTCDKIKEKMFIFENLAEVDSRSMQTLLRDVSSEVLLLALKGAHDKVKETIFSNMSKRAGELLRDDLEASGPVKVSEVEGAQKEILAIARRLADNGDIILGSKSGEEMI